MATPNYHNAVGTQMPQMMANTAGTRQFGTVIRASGYDLTVFRRTLSTGVITTFDLATVTVATTNGITPVNNTEDVNAGHFAIACGVDDQERIWLAGNSLATSPHMIRSDANQLAVWTSITYNTTFPGYSTTGGAYTTYHIFNRLNDGRLLYICDQRETDNNAIGRDWLGWILPLNSDVWTPLVDNGEFIVTTTGSGPERVYVNGIWVETLPHSDRVWVWGYFRQSWNDVTTQTPTWLVYNDTVTDKTTWKSVDGSSQTMPMTQSNSTGSQISQLHGSYNFASGQLVVDTSGFPHLMFKEGATSNYWHVVWNGSSWTWTQATTSAPTPSLFASRDGGVMMYRYFGGRIRMSRIDGTNAFNIGGDVTSDFTIPYADPIKHQQNGELHLLIPNGDTPAVHSFANHCRITH